MGRIELSFYCKTVNMNWAAIAELPSRLRRFGLKTTSLSATLRRYPQVVKVEALEPLAEYVRSKGEPDGFEIFLQGTEDKAGFSFSLIGGTNVHKQDFLVISLSAKSPESSIKSAMELLGLTPDQPVQSAREPPRTVFIAHRFDAAGQEAADKVALFLTLLGFECVTGRGYAPGSISAKVMSRLQAQAVVVVIWTPGEDSTWLIQESLLSNLSGKPLILIKEVTSAFKSGLLVDHEFIPFTSPRIEQTFIPLLEGLRAIGFQFTDEDVST